MTHENVYQFQISADDEARIHRALASGAVLVSGLTASGKSTLASQLARSHDLTVVDEVRSAEAAGTIVTSLAVGEPCLGVIHAYPGGALHRLMFYATAQAPAWPAEGAPPLLEVNVTKRYDVENRPVYAVQLFPGGVTSASQDWTVGHANYVSVAQAMGAELVLRAQGQGAESTH